MFHWRRAGGERVRRDDLDAVLGQVGPGLDALRVALADHEDDDRVADEALAAGSAFQSVSTRPASTEAGDVGLEREGRRVGGEAGGDGAALLAGRGVGLLELHAVAVRGRLEAPGSRSA